MIERPEQRAPAAGLTFVAEPSPEDALVHCALELLGSIVLELDRSGVCRRCFGPVERLGVSRDTLTERGVSEALPEPWGSALAAGLRDLESAAGSAASTWRPPESNGHGRFELQLVARPNGSLLCLFREVGGEPAPPPAEDTSRLSEVENRFRTMADHAPVLLWMSGRDSRCEFFNARWLDFTGRSMAEEVGVGWAEGIHPEDFQRCMHTYLDAFVARASFSMEYRLRRADGVYRWLYDQGVPRFTSDGEFVGYIGSCIDVTEQIDLLAKVRWANVELGRGIKEREGLLKELHHRVKNNLQVTCSLMSLEIARLTSGEGRAALEGCRSRVVAMALVHERLCQFGEDTRVDLKEYATELVRNVFHSGLSRSAVALELELDNVELVMDQAIPCGLILNELVSNSLRHAFPDGRAGTIRVRIRHAAEAGLVNLIVSDDGIGMQHRPSPTPPTSLGWQLISLFAEQLGASLTCAESTGTSVHVQFHRQESALELERLPLASA